MSITSEFEFDPCYLSQGTDHSVSLPFVLILLQELWRAASVTAALHPLQTEGQAAFLNPAPSPSSLLPSHTADGGCQHLQGLFIEAGKPA